MTGFGKSSLARDGHTVTVEMSAVNGKRQADIRLNMPRELAAMEPDVKRLIGARVSRASMTVTVGYELAPQFQRQRVQVDQHLAGAVIEHLRDLAREYRLDLTIRAADLLLVPGLLAETALPPPETVRELIVEAVDDAVSDLQKMQETEGETIRRDLAERCSRLRRTVAAIAEKGDEILIRCRDRLRERIRILGVDVAVDDERLTKELAFYAERSDITEERVRLDSHLMQFEQALVEQDAPGRHLEFLCQEMAREINTLCAKTTDIGVAEHGLDIKNELGRIREQVQNVE